MSDDAAPTVVVDLVRAVGRDATEEEVTAILASYSGLRAAADRLRALVREDDR
jgi:hypothetical protein